MESGFTFQDAIMLAQENYCSVWQFRNETGEGTMTGYDIFPGVMLSFNDFHMEYYDSGYAVDRSLFAIDHCREGRMEYASGDNRVAYTEAGDMKLDLRKEHTGVFRFPSCHYHGLTIVFDRELVQRSLPEEIRDFPTDKDCGCVWRIVFSTRRWAMWRTIPSARSRA